MKMQNILVLALVVVMLCAVPALAGHHGKSPHGTENGSGMGYHGYHGSFHGGAHGGFAMLHGLDLTEAQTDQIVAIFERYADTHAEFRQQMRDARRALTEAIHAEGFTEAEIETAAQAVGDQLAALSVHRAHMINEIRAVLTAEQLEQLKTFKTECFERKNCHQRLDRAIQDYQEIEE